MPGQRPSVRRRPGDRAGIDLTQIIETARALEPDALTMQAVARRLGVDRSALNYHVSGRAALLRLVAVSEFHANFVLVEQRSSTDWKASIATFAAAVRDSMIATGVLAEYVRLEAGTDFALLHADTVLQKLLDAGFVPETAGRALHFVAAFSSSFARDLVMARRDGEHPQGSELAHALQGSADDTYPALRHVMATSARTHDLAQFDFDLRLIIQGMDAELSRRS